MVAGKGVLADVFKLGGGAVWGGGGVGRTAAMGDEVGDAVSVGVKHAVNSRAALKTGPTMTKRQGFLSRSAGLLFIYLISLRLPSFIDATRR